MNRNLDEIIIIGAGCFGVSAGYHLVHAGFSNVTILDRAQQLPAEDAASNDFNRIVRTSYSDTFYSRFAEQAIQSWRDSAIWGNTYRESGVVVLGSKRYVENAYNNDVALGLRIERPSDIRQVFPPTCKVSDFKDLSAYLNRDSGWADAAQGVSVLLSRFREAGGKVLTNKRVVRLIRQDGKTTGVECEDGSIVNASYVIIATGSWTPSTFPELSWQSSLTATGQCIAMIELTQEEANAYRDCPVVLNFDNGFYVFPPNHDNIVKMAIHGAGITHTPEANNISTPRTIISHPEDGLSIPKSVIGEMRAKLGEIYPELALKPFLRTRMCWYADSLDDDWIIGFHPSDPAVIVSTGGSGHAYKFLPVLGSLTAQLLAGTLDPTLAKKFAVDRQVNPEAIHNRAGQRVELDPTTLCTPEDLSFSK